MSRPANPAVRQGLIFGAILAVLLVLNALLSIYLGLVVTAISSIIVILVCAAAYIVAGMRAAQQTGQVNTGLLAGLITGAFSSLINAIVTVVLVIALVDTVRKSAQATSNQLLKANHLPTVTLTNSQVIASQVQNVIIGLIIASVLGLGLGALGGLIGRSRAKLPEQVYQESMYGGLQQPVPPTNTPQA